VDEDSSQKSVESGRKKKQKVTKDTKGKKGSTGTISYFGSNGSSSGNLTPWRGRKRCMSQAWAYLAAWCCIMLSVGAFGRRARTSSTAESGQKNSRQQTAALQCDV